MKLFTLVSQAAGLVHVASATTTACAGPLNNIQRCFLSSSVLASSYCSSYIKIPVVTVTFTPSASTNLASVAATATQVITSTVTSTVFSTLSATTSTTTSTTSTDFETSTITSTLYSTETDAAVATTFTTLVTQAPVKKRTAASQFKCITSSGTLLYSSSIISSVCSCLKVSTKTVIATTSTVTKTNYFPATTSTATTSTLQVPATSITSTTQTVVQTVVVTSNITSTSAIPTSVITSTTATSTETDVVTSTIPATPCVPTVILASPTAIVGVVGGTAPNNFDDESFTVNLPFPVTFYGQSSATILVSVNGWMSIVGIATDGFFNQPLPSWGSYYNQMPDTSIAPYWDDLYIYQGTPQGIYYQIDGQAPARTLTIEWYTSHFDGSSQYYHFTLTYQEAIPNVVTYDYFQISDHGISATVGAQSQTDGMFSQYSFDAAVITPGTRLVYDPVANSFMASTIPIGNSC